MPLKVLLTLPPELHSLEIKRAAGIKAPPLGLAYIAAVLEKENYKVKILDAASLELSFKEWLHEVKSWHPDVIGFSLLTPTALKGYKAIRIVREELPDSLVVVGGPHPTFMYNEALGRGAHVVVRGEGEYTMLELMRVYEKYGYDDKAFKKVKGIAFKDKNENVIVTPPRPFIKNLDELPWPAYHLLPMDKYTLLDKPLRVVHVMASRGCPYGCIYCSTSYFWGRCVRFCSAKNIANLVEYLIDKYKAKYLVFTDDELTINRKFVYDFVREIKERGIDISFSCGSRVDHVDKKFLNFLYKNGCSVIYFGVESANQATLDKIGKKITVDQAKKVFRWVKEVGGAALASFIIGFPWETLDDIKNTIKFSIKLKPNYVQYSIATPYPGTPLFKYAVMNKLIEDWNWEHYTTAYPVMRGFHLTREQIGKMLVYAYLKFYSRLSFLWQELKGRRALNFLKILIRAVKSYLKDELKRIFS